MKNTIFTILSLLLFVFTAQAQAPKAFKYQTVVRDAAGQVLANQSIRIGIDLSQNNTFVYSEDFVVTTNQFGLVSLEIGRGTLVGGSFDAVDWSMPTSIRTLLDPTGGNSLQVMGSSELLSVPYALYAANGGGSDDDGDPTNEIQTLTQTGSEVTLSNGGGMITVNDADADPENEIELPADAQTGDLAYHDGTAWQRVPKGKGGQMLTLTNTGRPYWSGISTEGLLELELSNGEIIYAHPVVNNTSIGFNPAMTYTNLTGLEAIASSSVSQAIASDFDGEGNTAAIVGLYGDGDYAAKLCYDLEAYGFDDWYLPAAAEMEQIFLKHSAATGDGTFVGPVNYSTSSTYSDFSTGVSTITYGFNTSGNITVANNGGKSQVICVRK
ncbi:MAG: hypothetical protein H6574_20555 [Lewinellaceae bacterium]|nr:hypothetical protein [Lewinellaceae bacterium]MCB9333457.1 hypothetical protein [Lewinellaceae bacterium]